MKHALIFLGVAISLGASYRTQNFLITAPTPDVARDLAVRAERHRRDLAVEWLGRELPPWESPCPVRVTVGDDLRLRGSTSFVFRDGRPAEWLMEIEGPMEAVRQSILPHEITHAVFATHFGRPLPRWAEEGACVMVEDQRERAELERIFLRRLPKEEWIALPEMFAVREYPANISVFYAQGYSLVCFLVERKGKRTFVDFLGDGVRSHDWSAAARKHYGYESLTPLQDAWLGWARTTKTEQIAGIR